MGKIKEVLTLLSEAAEALQDSITDPKEDRNHPLAMEIFEFLETTRPKTISDSGVLTVEDLERFLELADDDNQRLRAELSTANKVINRQIAKHNYFMGWRKTSEELPPLKPHEDMPDDYLQSGAVLGYVNAGKYGSTNQKVYEYLLDTDTGEGCWYSLCSEHWNCGDTVTHWKPLGPDPE
jgi:hypothetical protein